jgi:hypothetical protein
MHPRHVRMDLCPKHLESVVQFITPESAISTLVTMNKPANVREPGDDWSGVTNQARRKKLQNRLNQRAYRQYFLPPKTEAGLHDSSG